MKQLCWATVLYHLAGLRDASFRGAFFVAGAEVGVWFDCVVEVFFEGASFLGFFFSLEGVLFSLLLLFGVAVVLLACFGVDAVLLAD